MRTSKQEAVALQPWREYQAIFDNAAIGIAFTQSRCIVRCNHRWAEMFGCDEQDLAGQPASILYPSLDAYEALGRQARPVLGAGGYFQTDLEFQRRDGRLFWCRLYGRAVDPASPGSGTVWIAEDVSVECEARQREARTRSELEAIFQNAAVGIMFVRNRVVQRSNRRLEELFGYAPGELLGRSTALLYATPEEFVRHDREAYGILERGEIYSCELQVRRRDGSRFWVRGTAHRTPVADADDAESGVIWILDDITERRRMQEALLGAQSELEKRVEERTCELANANSRLQAEVFERMQAEQKIWQIAHHDALTGLPNRNLLNDRVKQALAQAQRGGGKVALIFIDLDRFKHINDSLGHEIGDLFLKGVAGRIAAAVRGVDTVCRLGGDEFVVVLQEIGRADDARRVAEKILEALRPPLEVRGNSLYPSASLGIALYPDHGAELNDLLRAADNAMYHAKSDGRAGYRFFSGEMGSESEQAFSIEQQLHQAIAGDQFELHYQPIVALSGCRPHSLEVLLRWRHPKRGLVSPDQFIALAEETGLIVPIGQWALHAACAQAMVWTDGCHPPLPVAVNLSGRQFWKPDLVDDIRHVLADTGLPPHCLELEITESSLMRDVAETLDKLYTLAAMGVRLTVDDFGTGYSSLAYLKRFPVQRLKIDRSFVADLCEDEDNAAIVQAVVGLGRSMGMSVVAEGVETEPQLAALRELECPLFQGNWYARPQPAEHLGSVLAAARAPFTLS